MIDRVPTVFGPVILLLAAGCAGPATWRDDARPISVWSQYGPDEQLSVRAIVPAGVACPVASIDGVTRPMSVRATASSSAGSHNRAHQPALGVTSCELSVPATRVGDIRVADRQVPAAVKQARRIVVLGDTGCRVKVSFSGQGDPIQDCTDSAAWPWRRLAAAAAKTRPDVVIHLGDFHYREYCDHPATCKALTERGVALGYGWDAWDADFFAPAAPLLAAAPWVMVRGNHENCDRAGEGWMRFLAPTSYTACPDQRYRQASRSLPANNLTADAYRVDLGGVDLLVVDNAGHEDYRLATSTPDDAPVFERTLGPWLRPDVVPPRWLLSHRPIWYELLTPDRQPNAFQQVLKRGLAGRVQASLAGHQHGFSTLNFAADADPEIPTGRPAQVVVGGGGTQRESLDPASPLYEGVMGPGSLEREAPTHRRYDGVAARSGILLNRYSFLLLERDGPGWSGQVFDVDGRPITRCRMNDGEKELSCAFPGR